VSSSEEPARGRPRAVVLHPTGPHRGQCKPTDAQRDDEERSESFGKHAGTVEKQQGLSSADEVLPAVVTHTPQRNHRQSGCSDEAQKTTGLLRSEPEDAGGSFFQRMPGCADATKGAVRRAVGRRLFDDESTRLSESLGESPAYRDAGRLDVTDEPVSLNSCSHPLSSGQPAPPRQWSERVHSAEGVRSTSLIVARTVSRRYSPIRVPRCCSKAARRPVRPFERCTAGRRRSSRPSAQW